jgi:predicted RNA-binding protein with RPS1 domain
VLCCLLRLFQMRYQHALSAVQEVEGRGVVQGEIYRVRVLKVVDFGAYVSLPNGLPALLHISELSHEKIREVRDVVAEGQEFDVVCKGRDSKGFVQLSLKDLLSPPEGQQDKGAAAGKAAVTQQRDLIHQAAASSAQSNYSRPSSSSSSSSVGSSKSKPHPRAMTWRPSADEQQQQQQQQQNPQPATSDEQPK